MAPRRKSQPPGRSARSAALDGQQTLSERNPFRPLFMTVPTHGKQISPDKKMSFPCTNAALKIHPSPKRIFMQGIIISGTRSLSLCYTRYPCPLPPEPVVFVMLCQLTQGLSLVCGFCSSSRTFAIWLPSDLSSRRRPCLRLVLLLVSITMNTSRFSYRGLSPHKFTPVPGVHISLHGISGKTAPPPRDFRRYPKKIINDNETC
jgi:hypothetical protein